jgi:hypothetical protein
MGIYSPKIITERIERRFKPTRLAVKECNGIKYLCKSTGKNFEKYKGSGIYWKNIVKKYGKKNVKTIWVSDWFYCPHHIQEFALMYSEYNQVVESDEWANLRPENGLDGGICRKLRETNSVLQTKVQREKVENGTHPFLDGTVARETQLQRVKDGTHTFLGGNIQREAQQKIVAAGEHHFQDSEWHRESVQKQLSNGNHASQKKICCIHCRKEVDSANFSKHHGDNCKLVKAKPIIRCEHCGTEVTNKTNYIRYHGDNCKSKVG